MTDQNQLLREALQDIEQAHDLSLDLDHYASRQVLVSLADKIKVALAQPAEGGEAACNACVGSWAHVVMGLPIGTKLYTTPPASQEQAARMDTKGGSDLYAQGWNDALSASQEQWQTVPKDDTGEQWQTVPKASHSQAQQPSEQWETSPHDGEQWETSPMDGEQWETSPMQQPSGDLCAGCGKIPFYKTVKDCKTPSRCGTTLKQQPGGVVHVCHLKDSVCGDRPANWCDECPKRKQQPSPQAWANETGLRQIECPSCGDLAVAYDPQQPSGEVVAVPDTETLRKIVTRHALQIDEGATLEDFPDALDFQIEMARALLREFGLTASTSPKAEPVPYVGWYCAQCQRGVDSSEVTYHEQHTVCGRVITDDVPPATQAEPVRPLFAASVAARKWADLQADGHRMQSIAFDGGPGGPGTIDPWGVVRWGKAEPVRVPEDVQRVIDTARSVADGAVDLGEDFEVPSHLMAPLSLALDELDASALAAAQAKGGE